MSTQPAAVVAVGSPASGFSDWERRLVHFHGFEFEALTARKGESVMKSPKFACCGHQWRVAIYPGGHENSDDGKIAVGLRNMSAKSINLRYGFSIKDSDDNEVANWGSKRYHLFEAAGSSLKDNIGHSNFAKRSKLLGAHVAGTLVIEVRMRPDPSTNPPPFVGENPSRDMVLKLFMDDKAADIVFDVGEDSQQHPDSKKRSRTEHVKFHAHRFILNHSAPMLAALCPPGDGAVSVQVVPITDLAPKVFRPLLFYLYGGEVSEEEYKSHARDIIKAADRFEIVGLKLAAEAWYAQSTKINFDNVMEMLIYSDAKNLAFLKETVMDFIVANGEEVLQKVSLREAPEGLFADILAAMAREKKKGTGGAEGASNFTTMRISDLRKMVHEKGLSIDGSREMLITTLQQNE